MIAGSSRTWIRSRRGSNGRVFIADGNVLGTRPLVAVGRFELELEDDLAAGEQRGIETSRHVVDMERCGRIRRVLVALVAEPQVPVGPFEKPEEADLLAVARIVITDAADPRSGLAPRLAGCRNQTRHQVPGEKLVRLPAQVARHVVERDDFDPAAPVLQRTDDLDEIAVAGAEHDAIEMLRLQQGIDRHVEIGVRLTPFDANRIDEVLYFLFDDLESRVTHRRVILEHRVAVRAVGLGPSLVEGDVGVEPDRLSVLAAGDVAEPAVLHAFSAVPAQVLGVDVHADAQAGLAHLDGYLRASCRGDLRPLGGASGDRGERQRTRTPQRKSTNGFPAPGTV